MLVKIKVGDKTLQFNSQNHLIAILLAPSDREAIDKMPAKEQLVVSGPPHLFYNGSAEIMQWAITDWKGAKYIPGQVIGMGGKPIDS